MLEPVRSCSQIQRISKVQYSYAHGLLCLLKSEGQFKHVGEMSSKSLEELQQFDSQSFVDWVKKARSHFSTKFAPDSMLQLCTTAMKFIPHALNYGKFKGVPGASLEMIQKLDLANLMSSLIECSPSTETGHKDSELLAPSAFQCMLLSSSID